MNFRIFEDFEHSTHTRYLCFQLVLSYCKNEDKNMFDIDFRLLLICRIAPSRFLRKERKDPL